jgi:hypothetical protein
MKERRPFFLETHPELVQTTFPQEGGATLLHAALHFCLSGWPLGFWTAERTRTAEASAAIHPWMLWLLCKRLEQDRYFRAGEGNVYFAAHMRSQENPALGRCHG